MEYSPLRWTPARSSAPAIATAIAEFRNRIYNSGRVAAPGAHCPSSRACVAFNFKRRDDLSVSPLEVRHRRGDPRAARARAQVRHEHDREELTYLAFETARGADDPRSGSCAEACLRSRAREATIAWKRRRLRTWLISRRPRCTRPARSIRLRRGWHAVGARQNVVSGDRGAGALPALWTPMPSPRLASTLTELVLRVRRSERASAAAQRTRWALPRRLAHRDGAIGPECATGVSSCVCACVETLEDSSFVELRVLRHTEEPLGALWAAPASIGLLRGRYLSLTLLTTLRLGGSSPGNFHHFFLDVNRLIDV